MNPRHSLSHLTTASLRRLSPALLASGLFLPAFLHAQTTPESSSDPTPSREAENASETIELSPFEVSATADTGYTASSTLAGNRLRTSVRDVGSAISIYTAKFMEDTASTNAGDLLVYTTSGEVGGLRGNYSASLNKGSFFDDTGSGQYVSPTGNTRLRGLSAADVTRGFFLTDIPFDTYNTERVDIQRGANSILFGLASPGGVINAGLNQASYKNQGSVAFRADQYGSFRSSLDYNAVLVPEQLAVRIDALNDETQYQQEEAWRHDKRVYGTLRYDPAFLNENGMTTSLKVSYERGKVSGADPVVLPPRDQMTSWWTVANQARNVPAGSYDPVANAWVGYDNPALGYTNAGNYQTDTAGNVIEGGAPWIGDPGRWYENTAAVFLDPHSSAQGGPGVPAWMQRYAAPTLAGEAGRFSSFVGMRVGSGLYGDLNNQSGFWKDPVLTDPSIFDFYNHTLGGPNRFNGQDFRAFNVSFSETFFNNQFGFEVVYDDQNVDARQENAFSWQDGNAINIDINTTLPDGRPNPNFGRPYVASDYVDNFLDFRKRQSTRATVFYDLDLRRKLDNRRWGALLGRHTFTGMWSEQKDNHRAMRYSRSVLSGDVMQLINQTGNPWNWGQAAGLHYLGGSLAGATSPAGANLSGLTAMQIPSNGYTGLIYNPNTHAWIPEHPIGVVNDPYYSTFGASWQKQVVESSAFVWQAHLLDGVVVPTIGWRRDKAKAYQAATPPNNPATGFAMVDDPALWFVSDEPINSISGNNTSYSVVVHTPAFIRNRLPWGMEVDLTYNKSENFSPSAGGQDVYGRPMPAQSGSTKDYGVVLAFLDRRLQFRAIKFEASAQNAPSGDVNTFWVIQTEVDFFNAAHDPFNVANHPAAVAAYLDNQVPDTLKQAWNWQETVNPVSGVRTATASRAAGYISDLADTTSEGYEFEVHAVPLPGWDIVFNASKTEAALANNLKDLVEYMNDRIPVWTGAAGQMLGEQGAATTLAEDAQTNIIIPYTTGLAKNSMAQQELHKWRWNLVTNYTVRSGALKGFNFGGGIRWQDKIALGYAVKTGPNGNLLYDLEHPYYGDDETNYDLWIGYERRLTDKITWKIQLNARDLFQDNKLLAMAAQPDGSIATYRIAPETTYTLTNTFSF